MRVSRALLLLAVAIATSMVAAVDTPCTAAKYADAYTNTKAQLAACEAASGVTPLELPLAAKFKLLLCDACPELAAVAKAKTVPTCTVTQTNGESYTLRQQLTKLFKKCTGDLDSGSQDTTVTATTTAPKTPKPATVSPSVTTKTPAVTTKAPAAKSSSLAPESSVAGDADSSPSAASGSVLSGKPTTTLAPSSSINVNANDSSGSKSDASQQTSDNSKGSSLSIGVIAGVVACVLGVAAACVYFVVTRRRRKNGDSPGKYDDSMLDSSRGLALDLPFHNAMRTVNLNGNTSSFNSMDNQVNAAMAHPLPVAATPTQGHLWDDQLIVAARIPKDKVVAMTLLSRGGFGEVYRGIYNGQQVAIKTLLPETRKEMREINLFFIEIKLMARLEHQRIVAFVGVAWDSLSDVCVVTEYMEGGDLRDLLTSFEKAGRLTGFDQDKVKIALHVAHALTYMHSLQPNVLHRDLKSKNILLDNQLNAKLTDFGVSRERSDSTTMTAGVGTSLWMAPEVMLGRRYDHKADIFSFGVVLSELDSHALPYANATLKGSKSKSNRPVTGSAMLKLVSLGQLRVEFSENAPLELVAIAEACVSYDPEDRPSATDVLYMLHNVLRELHMSVSF